MRNMILLSLLLAVGVAACSSDNSAGTPTPTTPPPPAGITITGAVSDAFVDNATLTAFEVQSNGTLGPCVPPPSGTGCATATSNADGSYSLTIGTGWTGPVLLESTGGSYTDTVTGQSVSIPSSLTLSVFLPSVSAGSNPIAQITGWTTMAAQLALQNMAAGSSASAAATSANSAVQTSFAFVDNASLTTALLNLAQANCGTAAQNQASFDVSLLSAGLEELAAQSNVTSAALLLAIIQDVASDGMLDGLASGAPINVPLASGSVPLTTIYGSSLAQSLEAGIVAFQGSAQNVCKASQSSTMVAQLPTVSSIVANATYNYIFNGSVQGLPSNANASVTLDYSIVLSCPNDMGVQNGGLVRPFLAQNGSFSSGVAGTPNSYSPLNYNNACGNNTAILRIIATNGVTCGIGTSTNGPFTTTPLTLNFSSSDGGNHNTATVSPVISCTALAPPTFTVGGTVSGLPSGASLKLADTINGDSVTVTANGAFTLPAMIGSGQSYNVTASLSTCTVTNGSGTINGTNVTNVGVTCTSGSGGGGGITSALKAPKGIVWGNNLLYVPNSGANQVLVLSEVLNGSNAVTGFNQMATITQDLSVPVSAAIDSAGNLYVANQGNNSVSVYNMANGYQEITAGGHALISGGHLAQPSSVTIDSLDNVYVTNSSGSSVSVYQPVTAGNPSAGFNEAAFSPLSMDVASNAFTTPQVIVDAKIPSVAEYIAVGLGAGNTNTLLIYKSPLTNTTEPSFVLQTPGCTTPSGPTGIGLYVNASAPLSSTVFVSSVGMDNNDVFEYGALGLVGGHGGTCVGSTATNGTGMNLPFGVAVDPYDNVFVANAGSTGANANTITVYAGATFASSETPYFTYSPTAGLTCSAAPPAKGGGAQPYDNQTYCVSFSGTTDVLFTFTGTLTFTTPLVPGALSNCAYFASGTLSAGGATGNTGVVNCTGTTDASGNLHVSDAAGNAFTGTFSNPSGTSVSGNYSFGNFGPGGGVAAGTFTGTEQ